MSGVPRATSAIVVSNPVSRRFVTSHVNTSKPEIKIVFTVNEEENRVARQEDSKPRSRARKSDLAKCVSDFSKAASSSSSKPPQSPFIILGGSKEEGDIDSLLTDSFSIPSLPKLLGEGDVVFVECPECKKKLKQKSYRSHLRTHLGFKQFRCELCGDRFTRKNDVKRHMKLIHEKPRNFQCEECKKYFLTEENLQTHLDKHSRQLICRKCQHVFGKRNHYDNHIKYVHPDGGREAGEGGGGDSDLEEEKADPAILRRLEKRRCSGEEERLLLLGGEADPVTSSGPQTKTARLGQLVQMPDGTFIIVDCEDDCDGGEEQDDQSQVGDDVTSPQYLMSPVTGRGPDTDRRRSGVDTDPRGEDGEQN